jgi:hypothetical protein
VHDIEKEALEKLSEREDPVNLLRGLHPPPSKEELISWSPPRAIADESIDRFFTSHHPAVALVHEPTFREEYSQYRSDPYSVSTVWLAIFYAILFTSEIIKEDQCEEHNLPPVCSEARLLYRKLTIKALVASDYTKPRTYTLEALLLYISGDWQTSQDTAIDLGLILGMTVRLAMRMGLHKAWKAHPDLTPFRREMRRRLWVAIHGMDIMYSLQLSLPTTVRQEDCDCSLPRNLHDSDFSKDSVELPSSRPDTEISITSYLRAKYCLLLALDTTVKLTESTKELSREEVRKVEDSLLEVRRSLPPQFSIQFGKNSADGLPLHLRKLRINLNRLYHANQCMLYHKFLSHAHEDPKLMHYRRSCIDAAMELLNHQAELYLAWSNKSYYRTIKGRHIIAVTSVDFYIAGMAVAMDLHHGLRVEPQAPKASDIRIWGFDRRPDMIAALERSNGFWKVAKGDSIEAAKAWGLFNFVVNKTKTALGIGSPPPMPQQNLPTPESQILPLNNAIIPEELTQPTFDEVSFIFGSIEAHY